MACISPVWKVATSFRVATSHTRAVRSELPLARSFPSLEKATDQTDIVCAFQLATCLRDFTSQSWTVPPDVEPASSLPSGLNATARIQPWFPSSDPVSLPVPASQSLIDPSQLPV